MAHEILKPHEAAKEIGCSIQCVRLKMKKGLWDLGDAISPKQSGKQHWEYNIMRWKLDKFLGRDQPQKGDRPNG